MRFAIATATLASQAIPSVSFVGDKKHNLVSSSYGVNHLWDEKKILQSTINEDILHNKIKSNSERGFKKPVIRKRRFEGNSGLLLNGRQNMTKDAKEGIECDPGALDMGILQCGSGNYCIESQVSSTGGICSTTSSRRLQACSVETPCSENGEFCNFEGGSSGVCEACPCGNDPQLGCLRLGLDNPAGIPACVSSCTPNNEDPNIPCQEYGDENIYCEQSVDPDTEDVTHTCFGVSTYCFYPGWTASCCYAYKISSTFYGPSMDHTATSFSYYFVVEPNSQNFTMSYVDDEIDCGIIFNGETCGSCNVAAAGNDADAYNNMCIDFDCTDNPQLGMAGNTCDDDGWEKLLPIYNSQCYFIPPPTLSCSNGCNMCGDGSNNLSNPDATFPGGYSCSDLWVYSCYSTSGAIEEDCDNSVFRDVCCDGIPQCNICGEGGRILNSPNATITLPDYGEIYCDDLYYRGLLGLFSEDCNVVSGFARPSCCLEISTKEPSALPVTNSPIESQAPTPKETDLPVNAPSIPETIAPSGGLSATPTELPILKTEPPTPGEEAVSDSASSFHGVSSLIGLSLALATFFATAYGGA